MANTPPVADFVPAGTVTRYSVAIGRRSICAESYSKLSVLVPSHFQAPGSDGSKLTGTPSAASASSVPSGTIGWLKVTLTNGASGMGPSGA